MFLKSLSMKGFKSFADPTVLEFEPGITVVVGPNGSGKSNVVDAVTWVLGAQGPRSLRSAKMEDVIFAGTSSRPQLGRAEVSLTIDNASGKLPIDLSEVTITRTLFRTGDKTSILHEMGHIWLSDLQHDAGQPDAPEGLKADWDTVKKFIGHGEGEISRESHETFAEAAEQYFMEGKAPSQGLKQAFRSFKQWFSKIYGAAKKWDTPINDDIRGVFDEPPHRRDGVEIS